MTTEQVKVYVWTDFVCPYCLIGESTIHAAVEAEGAALVWLPFELRPHPTPTLHPEDDYLQTTWKKSVYPTAKKLGVDIRLPTISPQPYTRTAFIGMQWAADQGKANTYGEAVMRSFFQENRDIGDVAVLKQIVGSLGLDADDFEVALVQSEYARLHDAALALARDVGVQAVPSVLIGDHLTSGMRDVGSLRTMIRAATFNLL